MNYQELANPGVLNQPIYVPGKSLNTVAHEYGLNVNSIDKLASNENPFGPSPCAYDSMKKALEGVQLYPDGDCLALKHEISKILDLSLGQIIVGNGSNEVIELLGHVFLRPGTEVVLGSYSFIVYRLVAKLFGATVIDVPMDNFKHDLGAMLEAITENTRIVFVASPNNPTGLANSQSEINEFIEHMPEHVILCFDEAYAEYQLNAPSLVPLISRKKKVICLRTFSKIYGLGGIRLGYGYGNSKLISLLNRVRQPFNVNSIAQAGGIGALKDDKFIEYCRQKNEDGRKVLVDGLSQLGIEVYGGSANFVFAKIGDGQKVFQRLQSEGVIIRPLNNYGLPEFIRITIGSAEQNQRFLSLIEACI